MTPRALPRIALLLAGVATGVVAHATPAGMLRVSVNDANGRPFALYSPGGRFEGGVARDIMEPLAAGLGLRAEYLNVPRARVEAWLRDGRLDGACFLAPAWVADQGALRWSPPLFHIRQVIVSPAGSVPVRAPQQLFGRRLGTLLNYTYPELQPWFATGRIRRADAPSAASNIAKLARGRIDAFLYDDIAAPFAAREGRLPADARIDPLWAADNAVHCAFSPAFAKRAPRWHALLQAQVDSGRIEAVIAAYAGERLAAKDFAAYANGRRGARHGAADADRRQ